MAPTYIYYRVYDTNGVVNVKNPLPFEISSSKTIGRILKSYITPPFNVANVKLSIAQHEGHQAVFEAAGAQLFTPSSQEQITEKNGLLKGAGLSLTYPLGLKFLVKLKVPQSDVEQYVGKWQETHSRSDATYHYKHMTYFTLRKTAGGKLAAVGGLEHYTTTYTGFVDSEGSSDAALPSPTPYDISLSDFEVDGSAISFTRINANGVVYKVSGELTADGKRLRLTMRRAGRPPVKRTYKRDW
ncbi:hypothetical protein CCMSSC00406_0007568 [Pleurotus cornucopiae]|uniref:Uncharacterized protein n=1 Tax=Pleurotus cornucopiae TaxID=5321 RepID=A0ACB7J8Y3_PLECO|nr:hypothetical protein CCMSSC00406_0007568 [Pleurotus cornucopiae]